jgi:osmoprotectant transport system substrate-binding protein
MRFNRARVAGAAILALAIVAGACSSSGGSSKTTAGTSGSATTVAKADIIVGSEKFSESIIVNEIYAKALEAAGYKVTRKFRLGTREIYEPALEQGQINLVADYAATMLEFVNKNAGEASPDAAATVAKLNSHLSAKGLTALDPAPAIDANAFAVTNANADKYHLTKISDLTPLASQWKLGAPAECKTRKFCGLGLQTVYGLTFKEYVPLDFDGPLTKGALKNGNVQVGELGTTDGTVDANGFVILEDDKHLQNADNITPILQTKILTAELKALINRISAALTTKDLATLDKRADVDKEDPEVVADSWVKSHGFGG